MSGRWWYWYPRGCRRRRCSRGCRARRPIQHRRRVHSRTGRRKVRPSARRIIKRAKAERERRCQPWQQRRPLFDGNAGDGRQRGGPRARLRGERWSGASGQRPWLIEGGGLRQFHRHRARRLRCLRRPRIGGGGWRRPFSRNRRRRRITRRGRRTAAGLRNRRPRCWRRVRWTGDISTETEVAEPLRTDCPATVAGTILRERR